ncbi:MAG: ROK family protein [Eubacterium sp.]|nr:ROK family protein [Eubacterium sp.]
MKYAIAIDIGGTNTRVALVDEKLNIVDRHQFATDSSNPEVTLGKINDIIKKYDYNIAGAGMSCPGPLDLINGKILTPPNLNGKWHNLSVAKELSKMAGIPVYLDNDANLAALAEAVLGEGKDYRFVQFLTVSTGLGSGFVIDKQIYLGAHGYANEVANCIMIQDGPSHGSIIPGGIEAISSGTAITTRALNAGLDVKHAGEVNVLAVSGNQTAKIIMDDAKNYLANFIAFIYAFADPEIVILGGSVALKIDGFVEDVEALVKSKVYDNVKPFIKVRKSTLNEDSGLIGAAYLALSK